MTTKSKDKIIDMGAIYDRYKRFWWLFALSLAACLAAAAFYLHIKPKEYRVMASVMISDDASGTATGSLLKSLSLGGGGSKVDDEVIVMSSQGLCVNMIKQLKLNRRYYEKTGFMRKIDHYNTSPIEVDVPDEILDTLMTSLHFKVNVNAKGLATIQWRKGLWTVAREMRDVPLPCNFSTPYGMFRFSATRHFKPGRELTLTAMVYGNTVRAESLMEDLNIGVMSKKANAIQMSVTDTHIDRGKDMLNTLIALFNERGQAEKDQQAINTGRFIDERIALIYNDLAGSEASIEDYKRRHNMADVEMQTKALITRQQMADNNAIALETKYRIVSMIKDFVSDPRNNFSYIPFGADSTAAAAPVSAYNALIVERTKLQASATDNNQQLQAIDEQIAAMRHNVLTGVNNSLRALKIQIDRANSLSSSSLNEMGSLPTQEREMRSLYRQQGIQNALYTFLLQKREENQLLLAATTPRGKVVDNAYPATKPVAPKTASVLLLALLLALLLPAAALYVKRLFTTKFATQDELEELVDVPVLGEICHNRHKEPLVVKPGSTTSIAELFRLLRNNMQFLMTGRDSKVVVVTSSVSGEGKSFVSTNLAASFALLHKRVALVGMDIRSPKLAQMLDLNEMPGTTNYLADDKATIHGMMQQVPQVEGLDVMVAGAVPPNPSELLLGERTRQLIDELRQAYDVVIIDSAPIALVSDTLSIAPMTDAVLFVTRANHTKRSVLKFFNTAVERQQLKNAAVVLNDSNPKLSQGYGYGYGADQE